MGNILAHFLVEFTLLFSNTYFRQNYVFVIVSCSKYIVKYVGIC